MSIKAYLYSPSKLAIELERENPVTNNPNFVRTSHHFVHIQKYTTLTRIHVTPQGERPAAAAVAAAVVAAVAVVAVVAAVVAVAAVAVASHLRSGSGAGRKVPRTKHPPHNNSSTRSVHRTLPT